MLVSSTAEDERAEQLKPTYHQSMLCAGPFVINSNSHCYVLRGHGLRCGDTTNKRPRSEAANKHTSPVMLSAAHAISEGCALSIDTSY